MTDWDSFHRAILAEPEQHGPRLVYADWLEERGECARSEFIRVQCELSHVTEPHVCGFAHGAKSCWVCALRRRESALLSQTVEQPCPRCNGLRCEPPKPPSPDWWDGEKWMPSARDDMDKLVPDCSVCGRKGVVPVQNCVRWAGKLGGREAFIDAVPTSQWHGGWWHKEPQSDNEMAIHFRFSLGFLGAVSLSCAVLVGELCRECAGEGEEVPGTDWRRPETDQIATCRYCHGSGRTSSLRAELAELPLTEITLSDRRPYPTRQFGWWAQENDSIIEEVRDHPQADLPWELWKLLDCEDVDDMREPDCGWKWYASAAYAQAALSRAALAFVGSKRKQEVMA